MNYTSKFQAQQKRPAAIQISINNPIFDMNKYLPSPMAPALRWHVKKHRLICKFLPP